MQLSSLLKYFPLPKFINPIRIGISFSDLSIKAIIFEKGSFGPVVKSMLVPLEQGIIKEGVVLKEDALVKKLGEVKENFNSSFVSFTIPDEITYIFNTSVPVIQGKDATEALAFSIEENVPLSLSDTLFDFTPISVRQTETGHEGSFIVSACVKNEVEKIVSCLEAAGFDSLCAIPESQAIANSIIPKDREGFSCIVHVRDNRVGMYLVNKNIVDFATIRTLAPIDYEKQIADEYEKFAEYYNKYGDSKGSVINSVFVCGEFDYAKKALSVITERKDLSGKVLLSNIWSNILSSKDDMPTLPYEKSLSFAGSVGAAITEI